MSGTVHRLADSAGVTLVEMSGVGDLVAAVNIPLTAADDGRHMATLTLVHRATDAMSRMTAWENVAQIFRIAARGALDSSSDQQVWYERYEPDEMPKRALVHGGRIEGDGRDWHTGAMQYGRRVGMVTCVLEHGEWESVAAQRLVFSAATNAGHWVLPPMGNAAGRIKRLIFEVDAPPANFVLGIRPRNYGVLQFSSTCNAGASAHSHTDNNEELLWTEPLSNLITTSDYRHLAGDYRLYGLIVSSLTTVGVRMAAAGASAPQVYQSGWINTSIQHFGNVSLPVRGVDLSSAEIGATVIGAYAQAYSPTISGGSPAHTTVCNVFSLIPAFAWLFSRTSETGTLLQVDVSDRLRLWADYETGGTWVYPHEGGVLPFLVTALSVVGSVTCTIDVVPRWNVYRGSVL